MPADTRIADPPVGTTVTRSITFRAHNTDVAVRSIASSNPAFAITPTAFTVKAGDSIVLSLRYTALDSGYAYARFIIDNDACPTTYHASAGYVWMSPATPTLRLTSPEAGATIVAEAETLITWEGVALTDTVRLEYTTDSGANWIVLAPRAAGLRYAWRPPVTLVGKPCRIRVLHGPFSSVYDSGIEGPQITWQQRTGMSSDDRAHAIRPAIDGSFWVAGANRGNSDECKLVFRFDSASGEILQRRDFGRENGEKVGAVLQDDDGSVVLACVTLTEKREERFAARIVWSVEVEKTNAPVATANWIERMSSAGSGFYQYRDDVQDIVRSNDGDYVLAVTAENGFSIWLIGVDRGTGKMRWQKQLGGYSNNEACALLCAKDGALVVGGIISSSGGDVTNHKGGQDGWVVKLDPTTKNIVWQRTLGGSENDAVSGVIEASDGSYVVVGTTRSSDGDVRGARESADAWIVKLNAATGDIIWQKTIGGSADDVGRKIREASDGSYVMIGTTKSADGGLKGFRGVEDAWLFKMRPSDGSVAWQRPLGGSKGDQGVDLALGKHGEYYILGQTESSDYDATGVANGRDVWYARLDERRPMQIDTLRSACSVVRLRADADNVDMGVCSVGSIRDSVVTSVVRNPHPYPLDIRAIAFTGTDAASFSFVAKPTLGKLAPGHSITLSVRFRPHRYGSHAASLRILTATDTTVTMVAGQAVVASLQAVQSAIDFGEVVRGTSQDSSYVATIVNTAEEPRYVHVLMPSWPDDKAFMIIDTRQSFDLKSGDTLRLSFRFTPNALGRVNTAIVFVDDTGASVATVRLFGHGVDPRQPKVYSTPREVVFQCAADTIFETRIYNVGDQDLLITEATIGGIHGADFNMLTTLPIVIPAHEYFDIRAAVRPAAEGSRRATLFLRTNITGADSVYWLPLQARQERVGMVFRDRDIDLGLLSEGTVRRVSIELYNAGTIPTTFRLQAPSGLHSDTVAMLDAGRSMVIVIRVPSPAVPGAFSFPVIVTDNICGVSDTMFVRGSGDAKVPVHTTIAMNTVDVVVGQPISLTMSIVNTTNLDDSRAPRRFEAVIEINPTVVHLLDPAFACLETDAHSCTFRMFGVRGDDSTLATIPAVATLGTTDNAPVRLVAFRWLDTLLPVDVAVVDGAVRITDVCREGGPRLYVPKGAGFSLSCQPNPASSTVELRYGLAEESAVTIEIIDRMGRVVQTPVANASVQPGTYTRMIDVGLLGAGPYMVVLRSTNAVLQTMLVVVR
ncbi:MAG: choice-of-anchor D domain-containing protein [Candidatus Kapabacteria bacterium]|nr:choice-of-anchor D domain-containing protein [Candidatus Kapabacteria bacterium]